MVIIYFSKFLEEFQSVPLYFRKFREVFYLGVVGGVIGVSGVLSGLHGRLY